MRFNPAPFIPFAMPFRFPDLRSRNASTIYIKCTGHIDEGHSIQLRAEGPTSDHCSCFRRHTGCHHQYRNPNRPTSYTISPKCSDSLAIEGFYQHCEFRKQHQAANRSR